MLRTLGRFAVLVALTLPACSGCGAAPQRAATASAAAAPSAPATITAVIDARLRAAWTAAGLAPAPAVDDAGYLRRVYLDIGGVIPPSARVSAFLADKAPDKRARVVDELLASPLYASHWTDVYDRLFMGSRARDKQVDRPAFRAFLRERLAENQPWDALARDIVTATGVQSAGGKPERPDLDAQPEGVNGAVNWTLRHADSPPDMAGAASRALLGVQIQCAQCHDHKTERWTTDDFRGLAAAFMRTTVRPVDGADAKGMIRRVEVSDGKRAQRRKKGPDLSAYDVAPRALDGTSLEGDSRRKALAAWMTTPTNPWFAKAYANRLWAHFLGAGLVSPVDDLRPSNPGPLPDLLDAVAADVALSRFDAKHLIRALCATEAYQRASSPPAPAGADPLWSRFPIEPMTTDELLSSILAATGAADVLERVTGRDRAALEIAIERNVHFLFDVDEAAPDDGAFDGTIAQALFLSNGLFVNGATSEIEGTDLARIAKGPGTDAEKVKALYLRTLSREPAPDETAYWVAFLTAPRDAARIERPGPAGKKVPGGPGADPMARLGSKKLRPAEDARGQAFEDLFWALVNASEFVFNH